MDGSLPSASMDRRRTIPPDHWQLDSLQWALFTASFTRTAPGGGLRRLLDRDGGAMRAAGILQPEPIAPKHDVTGFDCGEQRLNELLKRSAAVAGVNLRSAPDQPQTFVAAAGHRVVCFYTARRGSLSQAGGDESDTVALTIIPHFAVDRRWQDRGISADLLWHLVRNAYTAAPATGAHALFGYALNRRVRRLYLRLGARPLPHLIHPLATMITFADVAEVIRHPVKGNEAPELSGYDTNTVVTRNALAAEAEADGRMIAFNIQKGSCYEFSAVTALIWRLIVSPTPIGAVCEQLIAQYDVDLQSCHRQVLDLLTDLHGKGLVETVRQGPAVAQETP
jgi:GNAT superfamily N-acetyltransferase